MYDSAWQAQTIDEDCMMMFDRYDARLRQGMSKELARTVLPVGTYTEMYWKIDLRNLFNFLKQRLAPEAQHEIKVYAEAMVQLIKEKIPLSYKAFENYILNTITLSAKEIETIKGKNDKIFSVGEREELNNKLGILGLHQLVTANQIE
jgi:thymidylate synthase (FAD)